MFCIVTAVREGRGFNVQSSWSSFCGCRSSSHRTISRLEKIQVGVFWWNVEAELEYLGGIFCFLAVIPSFSLWLSQSQTYTKYMKRHVGWMYKPFQRCVPVILCDLSLICPHSFLIATFHHFTSVNVTTNLQVRCFEICGSWRIMFLWFAHVWFLEFTETLRFAIFLDTTQRIVIIPYRRFGTTCLFHLQASINPRIKEILTIEDATDRLSRNVGKELPLHAA